MTNSTFASTRAVLHQKRVLVQSLPNRRPRRLGLMRTGRRPGGRAGGATAYDAPVGEGVSTPAPRSLSAARTRSGPKRESAARQGSPVGGGWVRNPRRPSSRGSRVRPQLNPTRITRLPSCSRASTPSTAARGPGRRPGAECPAARRWRQQRSTLGVAPNGLQETRTGPGGATPRGR